MLSNNILNILNTLKDEQWLEAVVFGTPAKANVELDTTANPVAVLFVFRDGAIDIAQGMYREIADINVLFLTHQSQLAFGGEANEALMADMVSVATEFVARLIASDMGEVIGDEIAVKGVYDYDDKNTTGVSLQFRMRALQGVCLIPTEPEPEPEPEPSIDPEPTQPDEDNTENTDEGY